MGYVAWSVVFGEQPTAAKWNILGENDESFNDGTGIGDDALLSRHYSAGSVDAPARSQVVAMGNFTPTGNGAIAVTGVGFTPKAIIFVVSTTTADNASSTLNAGIGVGMATSSALRRYISATTRSGNGGGVKIVGTKAFGITTIASGGGSQNLSFEGDLTSMDADGFTVTISSWIVQANVMWLAIA